MTILDSARITPSLEAGERLLWSARPRPADEVRADWTIWALPIGWTTFSAGVTGIAAYVQAQGRGAGASLWTMAPFLLIGLVLLVRPWVARWRASGVVYAATDRRLLRFDGGTSPTRSIAIADLGPVESDEGRDGYGALHIHLRAVSGGTGRSISYWRLRGLPDVGSVRRIIAAHIIPRDIP